MIAPFIPQRVIEQLASEIGDRRGGQVPVPQAVRSLVCLMQAYSAGRAMNAVVLISSNQISGPAPNASPVNSFLKKA